MTNTQQSEYLCLIIRNEEYGIKATQVRGILEPPTIRQVPRAPSCIAGVANIRGRIVPVLDPVKRFGLPPLSAAQHSPATTRLVLVQSGNAYYGILADGIASITYLSDEIIEPLNPIMVDKTTAFLTGMVTYGDRLIYLLDPDRFITAGLSVDRTDLTAYDAFSSAMNETLERAPKKASQRFLCLRVADEEYGVDLSVLYEVIPGQLMEPTTAGPEYLRGLVKASDGIFPAIDLQKKFHLDPVPYSENSRIVVIDSGGYGCGLLANSVTEILNIADEDIKQAPAIRSQGRSEHIRGVAMLEEGKRLLILLDETRILTDEEMTTLQDLETIKMSQTTRLQQTTPQGELLTFVTFTVAEREFAFSLHDLSEVILYKEPTTVPKAPPFVRGLIAVRGELVPVLDVRKRFALSGKEETERSRILIIQRGDARYGVVADAIAELVSVPADALTPPPPIVRGIDSACMQAIILMKDSDRTPIILDIEAMMNED